MNSKHEGIHEWGGPRVPISSLVDWASVNRAREADGLKSGLRTSVSVKVDGENGEIVKKPFPSAEEGLTSARDLETFGDTA